MCDTIPYTVQRSVILTTNLHTETKTPPLLSPRLYSGKQKPTYLAPPDYVVRRLIVTKHSDVMLTSLYLDKT